VEYWTLFARACDSPVRITCDSPTVAHNYRTELYNFRQAIRAAADHSEDTLIETLRLKYDQLSFSVTGRTLLVFIPSHYLHHTFSGWMPSGEKNA
jgi:hypothetical protein